MTAIERLLEVMRQLRDPETGCPWDQKQTFETIAPYTIEEAYEVADAVARGNLAEICDELGDLQLQVVFQSQIAAESGQFDFDDVCQAIVDKMVRRHPHVFGDTQLQTTSELNRHWEATKASERQAKSADSHTSAVDGVALNLPALTRAEKIQKRAARVGFDWQEKAPVVEKIHEELNELLAAVSANDATAVEDELGDLIFSVVNLARHLNSDPETALRRATRKFEGRFRQVEQLAAERAIDMSSADLSTLDELWNLAKDSSES